MGIASFETYDFVGFLDLVGLFLAIVASFIVVTSHIASRKSKR